jgi:hypothetical protein
MRSTKFAVTLGALALGTALSAMPALAQDYHVGRTANDGGMVAAQNAGQNTGSRSNERSGSAMGNHYAFGAQGQKQGRGIYNYSGSDMTPAQDRKYAVGRAANDGGLTTAQFNNGEQTSGSASNRQANSSNTDTYSFGAQGQQTRSVR